MAATPKKITGGQRRLDQAVEYVARTWFPANPEILKYIHKRIEQGEYDNRVDLLIEDIKKDFAIFTFVLKELRDTYPEESEDLNPLSHLRSLDSQQLKSIVAVPADQISAHSFAEMERPQAARFKHFLIGCSTTELLSQASKRISSSDNLFTLSVVRHLGLNLVAWNYPSIYGRVLQTVQNGTETEFDNILTEQLGFEPIKLASSLTLPIHMEAHYSDALGITDPEFKGGIISSYAEEKKLCEIGEAFAVLNDPDTYPSGNRKSARSVHEIESILGAGSSEKIKSYVKQRYQGFFQSAPIVASHDVFSVDENSGGNNNYGKALFMRNPYVARLSEPIRERIADAYTMVTKAAVSTDGIQFLATEVLPNLGFQRGCIFLLEKKDLILTPRLRIGRDDLKRYKSYSCLDTGTGGNPVVDAFFCTYPVKQVETIFLGDNVNLIAGALGEGERAGVLYLEMSSKLVQNSVDDILILFKAFRRCVNDCLNLR